MSSKNICGDKIKHIQGEEKKRKNEWNKKKERKEV